MSRTLKYYIRVFLLLASLSSIFQCSSNIEPEYTENKDDYLPLKIGNTWDYSFNSASRDDIDQNSGNSQGSATIKLFSITEEGNEIKYYLDIHKEGRSIYRDLNISSGEQIIDTSYILINDTLTFIEDSSGVVRNDAFPSPFFWFKLPRYALGESDTLIYHDAYTTYIMIKNIGIISYGYDTYHNGQGTWGKWTLESYELN